MKKLLFSVLLLTLIGFSMWQTQNFGNGEQRATVVLNVDYPHYSSISHLASKATYVIRGKVLDERVEMLSTWLPPENQLEETGGDVEGGEGNMAFTIFRLQVLDVYRGEVELGDIIEVKQMGGQINHTTFINEGFVPFSTVDDLILFLNEHGRLLNPTQSAYFYSTSPTLKSLNSENDLTLTKEDLANL